jgi:hypothetical protein
VVAPVLSQPSLPLGRAAAKRAAAGVSDADVALAAEHLRAVDSCAIGLRFTGDRLVPAERFATFRRLLGDRFAGTEIDSSPGNPHGLDPSAHSVLTEAFVDEPGHPTRVALDEVLDLFRRTLLGTGA